MPQTRQKTASALEVEAVGADVAADAEHAQDDRQRDDDREVGQEEEKNAFAHDEFENSHAIGLAGPDVSRVTQSPTMYDNQSDKLHCRFNSYIAPMTMWLPDLEGRRGPKYRVIADAIDEDVQNGTLRAGTKLPPHRDLADHLGVTVTTITRAYTEAARRGLTSGPRRARHVHPRRELDDARDDGVDRPEHQRPDARQGGGGARVATVPAPRAAVDASCSATSARRDTSGTGRRWPRGSAQLGLPARPEHLALTAGAQHAMATSFSAVTQPGDTVLIEELTYSGMKRLAQQMHLKVRGVPMDAEGLRPDALDAACRASRARVLYCMPRLQNPTSAIMSDRRRRQIAAVADEVPAHRHRGRHLRLPRRRSARR